MEILLTENSLSSHPLIEKFAFIKEKYGDNCPIILYEPSINCQEKKVLKSFLQGNSSLHLFREFKEAFRFVQSLGISFILIVSQYFDEKAVIKNFQSSESTYGCAMFDFEEDAILKDLFPNNLIKSLKIKVYRFFTLLDILTKTCHVNTEDEEEVMVMRDLKDMTKEFRQESVIIWYDPQIRSADKEAVKQKFDIEERNIYDRFEELEKRIHNPDDPPFHLILTGKNAEKLVNQINQLKKSLLGLYVYCDAPEIMKIKNRKIFVEKTLEELIPKIKEGIRTNSKLTNSFPAFATEFDTFDKTHIYNLHYYLQSLVNFNNRRQAKNDFIKLAKTIYQSRKILEFDQEYTDFNKNKIFEWYTKESPVYKLVNNCLRIATSDSILYCRFILRDLERAIREEYHEQSHQFNGAVYRGAYISQDEWKKLQDNVGKEIEMYGFLSTSQDLKTAKSFLYSDLRNKILITIIIPPLPISELNEQGFAAISQNLDFNEAEILFNVRSKFRILEVGITKINDQGRECRHLVLLYGIQLLRKSSTKYQPMTNLNSKLPPEKTCDICGSNHQLFAFSEQDLKMGCIEYLRMDQIPSDLDYENDSETDGVITETSKNFSTLHQFAFRHESMKMRCLECLRKGQVPKDIPLISLSLENESQSLEGRILPFSQSVKLPFYGYQCYSCKESGKEKYYKYIALNGKKMYEQCSDCFERKTDIEYCLLLAETNPYVFWQDRQAQWEMVDVNYQLDLSQFFKRKCWGHGQFYLETQRLDLCLEYEKKFLSKLKRIRGRELEKLLSYWRIGQANEMSGKCHKAFEFYSKVLEILKIIGEENHIFTVCMYNCLASVCEGLGQYQDALDFSTKALNLAKVLAEDRHPAIATTYSNISSVSQRLGQYQDALDYSTKALDIRKAIYGIKHPKTALSYQDHASAIRDLGRYQEAFEYHKEALDIVESTFGSKHHFTVRSSSKLASVFLELGQYQEAIELFKKALDFTKSLLGEKHPETANSYNNYAFACMRLGRHEEAYKFFAKALSIRKAISGDIHPETATLYDNYAGACSSMGRYQEALDSYFQALDIKKATFGDKHPEIADSYTICALTYQIQGKYEEAYEFFAKALSIRKSIFGESHPRTADLYDNYGSVCRRLGKYKEAFEFITKALNIRRTICGEEHPDTATSYTSYADVCQGLGLDQERFDSHLKALKIRKRVFGENHPETAHSYNNYGAACTRLGKYKEASEFLTKALSIRKTICGDKHPDTATSYLTLTFLNLGWGYVQEALECSAKALCIMKDNNHPDTAHAYEVYRKVLNHFNESHK